MLEITEIIKILNGEQKKNSELKFAIDLENQIRLHTESLTTKDYAVCKPFLSYVESLLPQDKFEIFKKHFSLPSDTVGLTTKIFTAWKKIFQGTDSTYDLRFKNDTDKASALEYRAKMNLKEFWEEEGFAKLKSRYNSLVVCDLKVNQENELPEPYFYFLDISKVIDVKLSGGIIQHVIWSEEDKLIAICDGQYKVYDYKDKELGKELTNNPHSLGRCPVAPFWRTSASGDKDSILKKHPLLSFKGALDRLLFYIVSNEHLNAYARFPIFSAYESSCNYITQAGDYCENGVILNEAGEAISNNLGTVKCPVCESKRLDGAGSFVTVPIPEQDQADLSNPINILSVDVKSLDYNNSDIERRETKIYEAATGFGSDSSHAINEKQVMSIVDKMEAALKFVQSDFEYIIKWTESTLFELRYDSFESLDVSLGNEHYIMSSDALMQLYVIGKKGGFSLSALDALEDKYNATKFKDNPNQLQRQLIINNLDPARHRSLTESKDLADLGIITIEDFAIKSNLSSLIMKFERQNVDIVSFASGLSFNKKIESIYNTLKSYVTIK